jgi:hypothetical protein
MDHVSLYSTRREPARQPKAVAAGFEGNRNPRDRAASPDRLILPAMQQGQQPFWVRLKLLARLTFNTWNDAANKPTRLAQFDDGNDRAILVQGDEGSAQVIRLGHRGTPSVTCSDEVAIARRPPHSVFRPSPDQCLWSPARKPHARPRGVSPWTNSSSPVVLAMRPWEEICAVEVVKIEQEEHQRGGVAAVRRQLDHAVGGDAVGAHGLGWHFDLALELARATRWPTGRTRLS